LGPAPSLCLADMAGGGHRTNRCAQWILATPTLADIITGVVLHDELPRGEPLMDLVFARIADGNADELDSGESHQPMPGPLLETLAFPDGAPLPPSLRRWLAFDAARFPDMFADPDNPRFSGGTLDEFVATEYGEYGAVPSDEDVDELVDVLAGPGLTGKLWLISRGADDRVAFYVGTQDRHGEYPVVVVTDSGWQVRLEASGFDAYLAWVSDTDSGLDEDFQASMDDQHRRHPELQR
jgi:hypothetical protein